jgi:hypothetical protein
MVLSASYAQYWYRHYVAAPKLEEFVPAVQGTRRGARSVSNSAQLALIPVAAPKLDQELIPAVQGDRVNCAPIASFANVSDRIWTFTPLPQLDCSI